MGMGAVRSVRIRGYYHCFVSVTLSVEYRVSRVEGFVFLPVWIFNDSISCLLTAPSPPIPSFNNQLWPRGHDANSFVVYSWPYQWGPLQSPTCLLHMEPPGQQTPGLLAFPTLLPVYFLIRFSLFTKPHLCPDLPHLSKAMSSRRLLSSYSTDWTAFSLSRRGSVFHGTYIPRHHIHV